MNKFRTFRMVTMVLIFSLLLSNVAIAKQNHNKNNDKWQQKYSKKFKDVENKHWANKYIERMGVKKLIKGDAYGNFLPNKPAKNIEIIAMTIRIMGWEAEAKAIDKLPNDLSGMDIPNWAIGYVTIAYEKGIIKEDELETFSVNAASKRYVVAKYIIRALGMEHIALEHMDEILEFKDASSIPEGNIGYVYLIDKLGLMSGYKNLFNPNGNLKRAEMAALFSRLDDKIDSEKDKVEIGEFRQVNNGIISIKQDDEYNYYKLNESVLIYDLEGNEISLDDIPVGAELKLDFIEDEVVYIEIIDQEIEKILRIYEGKVTKIAETSTESTLIVKSGKKVKTFTIDEETVIKVEGQDEEERVNDIKVGDIVKVTEITEGNDVKVIEVEIQVQEPVTKVYEGEVTKVVETTTKSLITIRKEEDDEDDEDVEEKTFIVDEETVIKIEGEDEEAQLSDIKIGDIIKVTKITEGDEVKITEIEIQVQEPVTKVYEGEVTKVVERTTKSLITIRKEEDDEEVEEKTFTLDEETVIKIEGQDDAVLVSDIKVGDIVEVTEITEGDQVKVTEIEIQVQEPVTKVYKGKVISKIDTITGSSIVVKIGHKEKIFVIDEDTVIKIEGQDDKALVSDIKVGDQVKVKEITEGKDVKVTEIEIQVEEPVTKKYEGEVISIAKTTVERLITVRFENVQKIFVIGEETVIKKEGQDGEAVASDIKIGDKVKVTEVTEGEDVKVTKIEILK